MELREGDRVHVHNPDKKELEGAHGTVLDGNEDGTAPWVEIDEEFIGLYEIEGGDNAWGMGRSEQCFILNSRELVKLDPD